MPDTVQDPLVLGFDTSAAHCAAALVQGDRLLALRIEEMGRGQAERLMPLLSEVLAEAGQDWAALDALGVGIGPGNFTGIRISVAAARGLALALGRPAVGVSGFEALMLDLPAPITALIAAPRDRLYLQTRATDGTVTEPVLIPAEEVAAHSPEACHWVGALAPETAQATAHQLGGSALPQRYPAPEAIARAAARRLGQPDLPRPAPLYIRPADAAPSSDVPPVILDAS